MRSLLLFILSLNAFSAELISPENAVQKALVLQEMVENINVFENDLCNAPAIS